jgi:hypothetical protein
MTRFTPVIFILHTLCSKVSFRTHFVVVNSLPHFISTLNARPGLRTQNLVVEDEKPGRSYFAKQIR